MDGSELQSSFLDTSSFDRASASRWLGIGGSVLPVQLPEKDCGDPASHVPFGSVPVFC